MKITSRFKLLIIPSLLVMMIGLVMGIILKPNFGIDFTGGSIFTIEMGQDFDVSDVSAAMEEQGLHNVPVVKSGATADSRTQAVMRIQAFGDTEYENSARQKVVHSLKEKYPNVEVGGVERVGAIASRDMINNALLAVGIAAALMLVYIWIRFELFGGIAAILTLLHDVLIMIAVVSIFRIQINSTFIAAVLTIVGYSINNTIVVFDRVRENKARYSPREKTDEELIDTSIKETLTRSINTTITTLLTICTLYVLGIDSIREFAMPIIIGLLAGAYSSIFLAAPLWNKLQQRHNKKTGKQVRSKTVKI